MQEIFYFFHFLRNLAEVIQRQHGVQSVLGLIVSDIIVCPSIGTVKQILT